MRYEPRDDVAVIGGNEERCFLTDGCHIGFSARLLSCASGRRKIPLVWMLV